jgi:predicted RNA-binding protein with TRAM domain
MVRVERRGFDFKKMNIPKPVKVGEEYDVEINEVGSRGDGIARIKNFVVFVSDAKKGEKMRIKITDVRNRFALAKKVEEAEKENKL